MGVPHDDDDEVINETYENRKAECYKEVERFICKIKICTYGSLARRYPQWADILDDVLQQLRVKEVLDYDDTKPPPTQLKSWAVVEKEKKEAQKQLKEAIAKRNKLRWANRPVVRKELPRSAPSMLRGSSPQH